MSAPIDLRSDTVTRPTPAMREAMARAPVGDDVYDEDPSIRELEELAAGMTGKQAGLFVPSGCMANLIAQLVHVRRGDEVICGEDSHCIRWETGAGAAFAGAQYAVIPGNGHYTAAEAEPKIKRADFHTPGTALLWVENTHNMGGGRIQPPEEIDALRALADRHGLPMHLDGARVFNAAVALGVPVETLCRPFESMSFCLSKGLGAPVGSVLTGTHEFRRAAHRFRKMLGGGMRQAGIIAAAGTFALRHHVDRLAEDHANARALAERLAAIDGIEVDLDAVQTNIVMARITGADARELVARCRELGVLFSSLSAGAVRLVTHLDVTANDCLRAADVIAEAMRATGGAR
ncbi:MAG: low-specificity L-threonine aldolase [Acidobacteria bacterium]|nr:MAG: low-specificity L-threonine aldolase [Acidobacteriota bacterium]